MVVVLQYDMSEYTYSLGFALKYHKSLIGRCYKDRYHALTVDHFVLGKKVQKNGKIF